MGLGRDLLRIGVLKWADLFATYVMWMMVTYLTNVWNLNVTHAAAIVNVFWGLVPIMSLGMQFLLDSIISNSWMLLLSSLAYSAGLSFLWMSTPPILADATGTCSAYKPECIGDIQRILFYTALALIAIGMAGHLTSFPSIFDGPSEETDTVVQFKIIMVVAAAIFVPLVGFIAIPYIKPWSIKFGIPAICTGTATIFFLTGKYNPHGQEESPVLETKKMLIPIMIPIGMIVIMSGIVSSIGTTYFIEQANHMNPKLGKWKVPIPILLWFYDQTKYFFGQCYDAFTKEEVSKRYRLPKGVAVSMMFGVLCCITAAKVEKRRLDVVNNHGLIDKPEERIPMTMFWLLPQYMLLGALDGIYKKSVRRFFSPSSSKSYMQYICYSLFGLGIMGSALSVYIVGKISEKGGKPNWFQDTLNKSRLDNYYWTLAAMSAVSLVLYILAACCCCCCCSTWNELESDGRGEIENNETAQADDGNIIPNALPFGF